MPFSRQDGNFNVTSVPQLSTRGAEMTQEQKVLYDTEAGLIAELNKQAEALIQQGQLLSKEQEMVIHLRDAMLQLQPQHRVSYEAVA
jgi:hypothetical protein